MILLRQSDMLKTLGYFVHKEAINSVFFFFFFPPPPAFGDHRIGIVRDFEGPLAAAAAGVVDSCDDADRKRA